MTVDASTGEVKKADLHLVLKRCRKQDYPDTVLYKELTKKFLRYNITYLQVDQDTNVYINLNQIMARPNLIRLSVTGGKNNLEKLERLKNNWYAKY
ncbi:hypothetical protein C900_04249 [Fulvivirga imtechensis AK7]|uniref:Uncharacterized protein n=1 Tax=Fulvivirga imtechensis AK7 TaxID=1237149 RepID=L8K1R6_9BACT|nr:hypothetical protein C900_04249 [Fulvivirga imtechensis AK7]